MEIGIELSKCIHIYIYIYLYIHPITNLGEEWRNADCYGVIFLGRRVDPALADICRKRDRCCHPLVGRSAVCSATENFCLKISAKKLHKQHIQHQKITKFGCLGESPKIFGGKNIENAMVPESQPSLDDASHIGSIAFL